MAVLVLLSPGYEDIEAMAVIDILRRAELDVLVAGLHSLDIKSTNNVVCRADCTIEDVKGRVFDCLVIPGGEPGVSNLEKEPLIRELIQRHAQAEKWIAAICAAPRILHACGLLKGKQVAVHPSNEVFIKEATILKDPVVQDGKLITSRGPGTAMAFAYKILEALSLEDTASQLKEGMVFTAG